MLLSLQSIEDKNSADKQKTYSRIRTNVNIPWECNYIKYYVSSLNTKGNILITTKNDVIKIKFDDETNDSIIEFDDAYSLSISDVKKSLESIPKLGANLVNKRLRIKPTSGFKFTYISHRAGLVTGLLNAKINETYEVTDDGYEFDIPILDYANKLYLISKQGQAIQSNIGDREYTPSVIANVDAFIKDGAPLIITFETYGKPIKNVVNVDSFKMIELELVDFMYHPIILHSPMFITLKIEPDKVPYVDYAHM